MKKLALALMCAMSVLLIASCSKKDSVQPEEVKYPTIKFVNVDENYLYQDDTVALNAEYHMRLEAAATDANDLLDKLTLKYIVNNETLGDTTLTLGGVPSFVFDTKELEMSVSFDIPGLNTVEFTVATKANRTATAKINIEVIDIDPVIEPKDLEWKRIGGQAQASGLEEFGLQWTSNYKDPCASIKPVEGALFFRFDGIDFAEVTTEIAKALVFAAGEDQLIDEFHEISCYASATFDYVLGTIYNENLYLINLTKSTVENGGLGTTVTINGQWK